MTRFLVAGLRMLCLFGLLVGVAGCSKKSRPENTSQMGQPPNTVVATTVPVPPASTTGLLNPESVRYDADLDVFFVSNVNGAPSDKDGNGFISKIDPAHPATAARFIESGKNGAVLNGPKGMAIVGDTLWVADIDALRAFNKRTGAVVATIDFTPLHPTFLNDVAAAPDGTLYLTDTGIRIDASGATTHPGKDRIYAVSGRTPRIAMEDEHLASPNGIAWDRANSRLLLAPSTNIMVQSWRPADPRVGLVAAGKGGYDGIEVLPDGSFLITSWTDSSLGIGHAGEGIRRIAGGIDGPADLGVDLRRGWIAVPRLNANQVDWFSLPF
ncbi:MAG: SMP-30/gluconolactonase/LRE family protein [Gemmatimonadaceae bacterium]